LLIIESDRHMPEQWETEGIGTLFINASFYLAIMIFFNSEVVIFLR
jgi:hypothetical protein